MLRRYEAVEVREPVESLLHMKSWNVVKIRNKRRVMTTHFKQGR